MNHKKYILVEEENDVIREFDSMIWLKTEVDSDGSVNFQEAFNDIDLERYLIGFDTNVNQIFIGKPVTTILQNTSSEYFNIYRFRTNDYKAFRLLVRK